MKPIQYYAGPRSDHPDAAILDRISEQFGAQLQELNRDDKASLLICLTEAAVNPQQVFTQENFFTNQNGGEAWQLAQALSPDNQLKLVVAIADQLAYGWQN